MVGHIRRRGALAIALSHTNTCKGTGTRVQARFRRDGESAGRLRRLGWLPRVGGFHTRLDPARSPGEGHRNVTRAAQEPVILEAAFPAAVGDRDDVVRLPSRPRRAPALSSRAVGGRRPRARPGTVRLDDVESTELADPLVALFHLPPHVPRTAADFPLMHARVAAEGPARRFHRCTAPAADRIACLVPLRLPPLVRGHNARATGAHGRGIGRCGGKVYGAGVCDRMDPVLRTYGIRACVQT
jgi:hypothetical protein